MRTRRASRRHGADRIARRAAYDAYLASSGWRARRRAWYAAWLTAHGTPPQCRVCDRVWCPRSGHLHHLTYIRIGHEDDEDLVPLCARDHRQVHHVLEHNAGRRLSRLQASLGIIALLHRNGSPRRAS